MRVGLPTALLFLIGYASQCSGVCMVRAVREMIERRRVHRIAGLTLAAASAMLFTGVPLLLPNLLVGYTAFIAALVVGQLLQSKALKSPPGA